MNCQTCFQAIRRGEKTDTFAGCTFHEDPRDCVAATARRCARIADGEVGEGSGVGGKIRKEFVLKGRK